MNLLAVNHINNYENIYRYVAEQPRTEEELRKFLAGTGRADTTVRTVIGKLVSKDNENLMVCKDGLFVIDQEASRQMIDYLMDILGLPNDKAALENALADNKKLQEQLEQQKNILELDKKQFEQTIYDKAEQYRVNIETQMNQLVSDFEEERQAIKAEHEKELQNLSVQITGLENQLSESNQKLEETILERNQLQVTIKEKKDFIYQSINQKVLFKDSIDIGPVENAEETVLLNDFKPLLIYEPSAVVDGGESESFYQDIETDEKPIVAGDGKEAGKELNEQNHQRKGIRGFLTELLLKRKVEEVKEEAAVAEIAEVKKGDANGAIQKKPEQDLSKLETFRLRRHSYIQSIINDDHMTNQQKLAAYAFYSDFHGKGMERLLNFAGDNNINANMLIDLLESPGRVSSVDGVQNMLRQFAKASLFREKYKFAQELIAGDWYIVADYNGHKTKFQLVPLEEFNELRRAVNLPESKFCYKDDKPEEEAKEANVTENTPKEEGFKVQTFNINAVKEEDIPDFQDDSENAPGEAEVKDGE